MLGLASLAHAQEGLSTLPQSIGTSGPTAAAGGGGTAPRLITFLQAEQTFSEMRERPTLPNGVESITRVSPGVRLTSRSGRVQGYVNYSGDFYYRTGRADSGGTEWQNYLDASVLAEAVPGWLYLDARASITQQAIDPFGQPVGGGTLSNSNRTEVSTLWLSPYLKGVSAGAVNYEARVIGSATRTRSDIAPDSNYGAALLSLGSEGRRLLNWNLSAKRERYEYKDSTRPTTTDRLLGSLFYTPHSDLRFVVNAGGERADIGGPVSREYENYGIGFEWTPSPRTFASARVEERYFGRGHNLQIQYRTAQSAFTLSDVRDTNESVDPFAAGQPIKLYDVLYQQFAAIQPDPALREQLVLDYLALTGQDPNELIYAGTLTNGVTVQRRQNLGWALQGRRNSLTLLAYRTESERIDQAATSVPGANEVVIESGYQASLSHRLTPNATLSLIGSRRMVDATATRSGTDEKRAALALTGRLGRRVSGALGASYTVFNSATDPYRETELTGRVSVEF